MEDMEVSRVDICVPFGNCWWTRSLYFIEGQKPVNSWHKVLITPLNECCYASFWSVFLIFVRKFCRIHCTDTGCYTSAEVTGSAYPGMAHDEIKLGSFKVKNASPGVLGRCFIEVNL